MELSTMYEGVHEHWNGYHTGKVHHYLKYLLTLEISVRTCYFCWHWNFLSTLELLINTGNVYEHWKCQSILEMFVSTDIFFRHWKRLSVFKISVELNVSTCTTTDYRLWLISEKILINLTKNSEKMSEMFSYFNFLIVKINFVFK